MPRILVLPLTTDGVVDGERPVLGLREVFLMLPAGLISALGFGVIVSGLGFYLNYVN